MRQLVKIGVIGDFNPECASHTATNAAIAHAADTLGVTADAKWLPTPALCGPDTVAILEPFDGFWVPPGSPYRGMEGTLAGSGSRPSGPAVYRHLRWVSACSGKCVRDDIGRRRIKSAPSPWRAVRVTQMYSACKVLVIFPSHKHGILSLLDLDGKGA